MKLCANARTRRSSVRHPETAPVAAEYQPAGHHRRNDGAPHTTGPEEAPESGSSERFGFGLIISGSLPVQATNRITMVATTVTAQRLLIMALVPFFRLLQ